MVLSEKTFKFPKNNKNHDSNSKKVVLICQKPIQNGSYFHVFPIPTQPIFFAKNHRLSPKFLGSYKIKMSV